MGGGDDLGHVRFDPGLPGGHGNGDAVLAVAHEVPVGDAVDLDGWQRHIESPGKRELGPALPDLVRGGVESPIEAALFVDGALVWVRRAR
jgi:hypothetical protein